jgi:hypothetical protein
MKSRRRIAFPKARDRFNVGLRHSGSNQEIATSGMGLMVILRSSVLEKRMSQMVNNGHSC